MNIAVIFAGGVGSRMHSKDKPKQFLTIHGKPVIIHTLEVFENHREIDAIVVACVESGIAHLQELIARFNLKKVAKIVPGGETSQGSIYNGLCAAQALSQGQETIVLIHDGVRPLIYEKTITDNIDCVKEHGSAITCVPVKETVLMVNPQTGAVESVPTRANSRLARAPQSFYLKDILSAHRQAMAEGRQDFIDSCTMLQHYGKQLYLIEGPQENIKITTPDDFYAMRALLDARENAQIYGLDNQG